MTSLDGRNCKYPLNLIKASLETKKFKVVYTYIRHADFHCGIETHFHYGSETLIRHADYQVYLIALKKI
jgi:hypothetical protein